MDTFLGKLTNLSYDFFGAILPGFIGVLVLACLWWSSGPLLPYVTCSLIPEFPPELSSGLGARVEDGSVFTGSFVEVGFFVLVAALLIYFTGHILHWLARSRMSWKRAGEDFKRVRSLLLLQTPTPSENYGGDLRVLYEKASEALLPLDDLANEEASGAEPLSEEEKAARVEKAEKEAWGCFYRVARTYVAQNARYSLVATYQNKYTLHRSIAAAAAIGFDAAAILLLIGAVTCLAGGPAPNWGALAALLVSFVPIIWAFSGSYQYHWYNFGNYIVTEAYALKTGARQ